MPDASEASAADPFHNLIRGLAAPARTRTSPEVRDVHSSHWNDFDV
jgi:hypothetical protein